MDNPNIQFKLTTPCLCIEHTQNLLQQANNIGLSLPYRTSLNALLVGLIQLLSDEPARIALYTANIEDIYAQRAAAFSEWSQSIMDSIPEPLVLLELRQPPE